MGSYSAVAPLWDLSQASSFSQLPDDDFLALLEKQFSASNNEGFNPGVFDTSVNPQSIQSLNGPSPPSDDSSPSPASVNNDSSSPNESRRPRADTDGDDSALKRKASDDSLDNGPNQKNQHTANSRSLISNRRKSSGGNPDESRLLKRKEQNRAAQRAFRERKEKHVKDLEDKVAALEAKNEQAVSENVNLRDLLSRLQDENISLKQAAFTFQVSKTAGSDQQPVASGSGSGQSSLSSHTPMTTPPVSTYTTAPIIASPDIYASPGAMDWTSLTTFDPAMLSLLDDSVPQTTATNSALDMDFGFGDHPNKSPFTTIAANPMLMSFADFDSPDLNTGDTNHFNTFNFDMWSQSPQSDATTTMTDPGLDELFGGNYLSTQSSIDFNTLLKPTSSPSTSPISHPSPSTGTSGSSASSIINSGKSEAQSPISSVGSTEPEPVHLGDRCPKTREETAKLIEMAGQSTFVKEDAHKPRDLLLEKIVPCKGSGGLPKTEPRPDNVEVLAAWRDVTRLPNFKDIDINELCTEFSNKARCDGSRVVLEHPTYQNILAKLGQSQRQ